jgi:hypothetical protein
VFRDARRLLGGVLLAAALTSPVSGGEDSISPAEKLLFQTDHLANVIPGARLLYEFRKSGSAEPAFDDRVEIRVQAAADGSKGVSVAFFTRARRVEFPEVTHAEGNPVLLYLLERDTHEMERLTRGKSGYFRKAIRLALARAARVTETQVSYGGRSVRATEVTIAPYVDDPLKDRIGRYAGKIYAFTLSSEIPGGIYSVRTTVPPTSGAKEEPLIDERLRFVRLAR